MISTPYLSSDTICSGRPLKKFNIGDDIVLIQRVVERDIVQFVAIKGKVTGSNKSIVSHIYSYIVDKNDNELAGLHIPFISNGNIIEHDMNHYCTKNIIIDMIQKYYPIHDNVVTFKTIGVLCPETFISLTLSFKTTTSVTHTLLITNNGFMIVID